MSRLAELIEELCPDGVEYRPLGELLAYQQPTPFLVSSKDYDPSYPTPVLTAGAAFLLGYSSETHGVYDASTDDPVIIFDDFTTASKWVDFPFKLKSSAAKILTAADPSVADIRFLYFLMQTIKYQVGSHARHWIAVYSKMPVCCPPLEVQREIVRILDQFTTLEAELEAELEARRTQYEHYRKHLLAYESLSARGRVRWCALGDVVRICNGRDYKALSAGDVPVYGSGGVMTYVSDYLSVGPTVLIPRKGSLDNIYFVEGQFWTVDTIFYTEIGDALYPKFFFHYMKQMKLSRMNEAAGVPSMTQRKLSSIRIPIPSHEEQRRIADLLDRFDALVNDITSGLPAEIAARHAQYEHYRDRLLSFPEKAASGDDAS